MPPDNPAQILAGGDVAFPNDGLSSSTTITRATSSSFNLLVVGTYLINFQVSISESAQLVLALNGVELPNTVVGRYTGTTQIIGSSVISTVVPNSVVSVRNPALNLSNFTVTTNSGGATPVTANVNIYQIA